ncbi:MAG TPA: alanine/glycine:cation symporter family protein [Clostridia bacterium]|nr:alanine/glycine:cation symporter family protein [Clostridia bacterium]
MMNVVNWLNGIIWSDALVIAFFAVGIWFTVRLGFPQLRHFKRMWKIVLKKQSKDGSQKGFSALQSLALTVGGRVGVGNIAGIAVAILYGGPGAIFWMGLLAMFGQATAFMEASLGSAYKVEVEGQFRGGPSDYIEKGLGQKWYAILFAISTVIGLGICVPGLQTYNTVEAMNNAFGANKYIVGAIICALLLYIILGGLKRIGSAMQSLSIFMTSGYLLFSIVIIAFNITAIPHVIYIIFSSAFGANAAFGGVIGSAITWGVKRGIYSNEAGMGSGAIAAGSADTIHPAEQGLVQSLSVFIDTLVVCMITASLILVTDSYNVINEKTGEFIVENVPGIEGGVGYVQAAIDSILPGIGGAFVAISIFVFAFTSIVAFYYYSESALVYILPKDNSKIMKYSTWIYRIVFVGATYIGVSDAGAALWNLADLGIGLMAWLNLIAIFLLSKHGVSILKDYERQLKTGEKISFDPEKIGLPNADKIWKKVV